MGASRCWQAAAPSAPPWNCRTGRGPSIAWLVRRWTAMRQARTTPPSPRLQPPEVLQRRHSAPARGRSLAGVDSRKTRVMVGSPEILVAVGSLEIWIAVGSHLLVDNRVLVPVD